jgi:hypothetical protein
MRTGRPLIDLIWSDAIAWTQPEVMPLRCSFAYGGECSSEVLECVRPFDPVCISRIVHAGTGTVAGLVRLPRQAG